MSGQHAADRPSRPGAAALLLGLLGALPPALIVVPRAVAAPAPVSVSVPDVAPEEFAAGPQISAASRAEPLRACRCGERPAP
ncbi:hypothetical protein ABR737_43485 [Streptomyces sp. Edi2]|uniref:hypothetical protein n=1 Tax=Streptomyces sp. Edi2 TaxID=3162528 RepID=UPI003305A1F9